MVEHGMMVTCDFCGKTVFVRDGNVKRDAPGWCEFGMVEIGMLRKMDVEPHALCPECSKRLAVAISTMMEERK